MPPEPQAQDPQKETTKPAPPPVPAPLPAAPTPPPPTPAPKSAGQVDIDKILLPQKEVRKIESERRVSAGVLLDQEQKAGAEGIKNPSQPPRAPTPPAMPKPKDDSEVQPLETYQADIERVMRGSDVSVVSIAAAEAQRRAQMGRAAPPQAMMLSLRERVISFFKNFSMIAAGAALLIVSLGVIAYLLLRPTTVPIAVPPASPFIAVDDTKVVVLVATESSRNLMPKLQDAKQKVDVQLGLIARFIPSLASTTENIDAPTPMDAQTFLTTIAPNIPENLVRTVEPVYLLGVHVYDSNQPLIIMRVDAYQEAFSGMLSWEKTIKTDLAPLFTYTPRQHIPEENLPVYSPPPPPDLPAVQPGIPQGNSTQESSTAGTTTTTSTLPKPFIPPNFIDKIVENHDARVLVNDAGDIYFLWTFLDRNTLVITTNAATLREIISRLKDAPVTAIPPQ